MVEYDEKLARLTERGYLMPEIAYQRSRTMLALNLQAGEHVLDAGCGMGLMSQDIALAVGPTGRVVGIDNSQPMLELARNRCRDLPQIEFKSDSVEQLGDKSNSFDAAVCGQLLLYLPDVPKALAEFYRVLKPSGRIAIIETDWRSVLLNTNNEALKDRLFADWEASIPSPHLPGRLRGLLLEAGFSAVKIEAIPIINTCYLDNNYSTSMVHYMLDSQLSAETVLPDQADKFLEDLKKRSVENDYFFCVNRFLFTAVK